MKRYLVKRLIQLPIILAGVLICVFLIIQLTPGDPAATLAGPKAGPEEVEAVRQQLGLDRPVLEQFFSYVGNVFRGNFGRSYTHKTDIGSSIGTALVNTVYLMLFARIWSILAAIPLGIYAALHHNTWVDKLCMGTSLLGISIPQFWLGLILMKLFCFDLGWLPFSGMGSSFWSADGLLHVILPAFMLGLPQLASIARLTRSEMLEVMRQDYIKTARAKGVKQRMVVYKHALKNAALPLITVIGTQTGYMLSGSVVIENIFAWPGLGRYSIQAIIGSDYPAIQASVLLFAVMFLVVNLIVDLTYSLVDPRINY
ncbi:ABC transporter permease [Ruminococcaceae bacterium OttesenSCG-928-D13]|nr:ABC transporter permease [Ruminococcaceae bacterium OttesenSCG-928-D13]